MRHPDATLKLRNAGAKLTTTNGAGSNAAHVAAAAAPGLPLLTS
jgi:hypothetical protein